jgi:hypothetical protein
MRRNTRVDRRIRTGPDHRFPSVGSVPIGHDVAPAKEQSCLSRPAPGAQHGRLVPDRGLDPAG